VGHLDRERYTPLAFDLRGHGSAAGVRPITLDACVEDVLAAAPPRFILSGYSMGGRIALHVAARAPARVARLVLVATTAGIEDEGERAARLAADAALARGMEEGTLDAFVATWTAQPLFAGTPADVRAAWEADLRRNEPAALAAALVGLSQGAMESMWDRLPALDIPATVVVGTRDTKYVAIAERLVATLPQASLVTVPNAGHGLPREAPAAVAAAV
jgi:2-succinyl-6-hydroxy-2,4-cyclohexadiene-1-carboxylate synthase